MMNPKDPKLVDLRRMGYRNENGSKLVGGGHSLGHTALEHDAVKAKRKAERDRKRDLRRKARR